MLNKKINLLFNLKIKTVSQQVLVMIFLKDENLQSLVKHGQTFSLNLDRATNPVEANIQLFKNKRINMAMCHYDFCFNAIESRNK